MKVDVKAYYFAPKLLICLSLIVATLAVFWQVQNHEFVNYDDNVYVTENSHVQAGLTPKGLVWAFTSTYASNWHPLTWISHMLDCELYGSKPKGHHLTNLFLHIANTLLLFLLLTRMTGGLWQAAFVAAMFALHPLHVESVAWVAERKDVLCAFFWMLTMWAYVYYTERPGPLRYLWCLTAFALGLMSKPMIMTLPLILLLLDYWPLRRFHSSPAFRLILEKLPFLALAMASGIVTIFAQQHGGALSSLGSIPLKTRLANALVSYVAYIWMMVWPHRLAVFYPYPGMSPVWQVTGAGLLLVSISFLVIRGAQRRPYMLVGWLWYLASLIPVIGVIQVGAQAMADRYTYITLIGLFIMIAWGIPNLLARLPYRRVVLAISAGIIISSSVVLTWAQLQYWQNNMTLFSHALETTSNNYLAHTNLGATLVAEGKLDEGIAHYTKALQIRPDYALAHYNLASAFDRQGKLNEAITHYTRAVQIRPDYFKAHSNLGVAMARKGDLDKAISHFKEALRIDPDLAETHFNLGRALYLKGKLDEAISHFTEVVRIRPNIAQAHYILGVALARQGKTHEAISHLETALRLRPGHQKCKTALDRLQRGLSE